VDGILAVASSVGAIVPAPGGIARFENSGVGRARWDLYASDLTAS